MFALTLIAPKDTNGNSRRLYLVFDSDGEIHGVVRTEDELEDFRPASGGRHSVVISTHELQIKPSEYHRYKKMADCSPHCRDNQGYCHKCGILMIEG